MSKNFYQKFIDESNKKLMEIEEKNNLRKNNFGSKNIEFDLWDPNIDKVDRLEKKINNIEEKLDKLSKKPKIPKGYFRKIIKDYFNDPHQKKYYN